MLKAMMHKKVAILGESQTLLFSPPGLIFWTILGLQQLGGVGRLSLPAAGHTNFPDRHT